MPAGTLDRVTQQAILGGLKEAIVEGWIQDAELRKENDWSFEFVMPSRGAMWFDVQVQMCDDGLWIYKGYHTRRFYLDELPLDNPHLFPWLALKIREWVLA